MRDLIILTVFLASTLSGWCQFDFDIALNGFDNLRLGDSKKEVEKFLKPSNAPYSEAAWNSMDILGGGLEEFMDEDGMIDTKAAEAARRNSPVKLYAYKKPKNALFHGLVISDLQLLFSEDDELTMILVTLDESQMTDILMMQLFGSMQDMFGDTDCSFSVAYDPPPAYCSWGWEDEYMLTVSDMSAPGGGPGKTMHFLFEINEYK